MDPKKFLGGKVQTYGSRVTCHRCRRHMGTTYNYLCSQCWADVDKTIVVWVTRLEYPKNQILEDLRTMAQQDFPHNGR